MQNSSPLTLGSVVSSVTAGGFDVLISSYRPFESHPYHVHDRPAFVYVIDGEVEVRTPSDSQRCVPASMRLIPAGDRHQTRYGANAAHALVMGIGSERTSDLREHSAVLDSPSYHAPRTPATVYAERVMREMVRNDSATPLAIEALMLELLATGIRKFATVERRLPAWLTRVRERVDAEFKDRLSLESLALDAGVHPVHLSRTFRRYFGCSIAQYQRALRLEWAAAQLMSGHHPLSRIAVDAGFADHSEFTRRFTEANGVTPSRYRSSYQ
jgi:AraC family transcriptional regulator